MRWPALLVVVAGCGRVGFDGSDNVCPVSAPPQTLAVTGTTFHYTSFVASMTASLANTSVTVRDALGTLATTTSDGAGAYALAFAAGTPRPLALEFERVGYRKTTVQTSFPVDKSITGEAGALWTLGDGPLWNDGALGSVYSAANQMWDSTLGSIAVHVRDCTDNALAGATVTVDPPVFLAYQRDDGLFDLTATSTLAPYAQAVVFSVPIAPITVTATAPGLRFSSVTVMPTAGDTNIVVLRGAP